MGGEGESQRRRCSERSEGSQLRLCGKGAVSQGTWAFFKGTKNEFFPSLADILTVATKTHFQASRTVRQQIRVVTSH